MDRDMFPKHRVVWAVSGGKRRACLCHREEEQRSGGGQGWKEPKKNKKIKILVRAAWKERVPAVTCEWVHRGFRGDPLRTVVCLLALERILG